MPSPLYLQYLTTAHGFYFDFSISTTCLHILGGGGIFISISQYLQVGYTCWVAEALLATNVIIS
jgi:hypothetical protein